MPQSHRLSGVASIKYVSFWKDQKEIKIHKEKLKDYPKVLPSNVGRIHCQDVYLQQGRRYPFFALYFMNIKSLCDTVALERVFIPLTGDIT